MDKNLSAAVTETFVKLHEEGTIYRANRLVNWCVRLNTTLSNLEVSSRIILGTQFGRQGVRSFKNNWRGGHYSTFPDMTSRRSSSLASSPPSRTLLMALASEHILS